jgi:hypothetical protein
MSGSGPSRHARPASPASATSTCPAVASRQGEPRSGSSGSCPHAATPRTRGSDRENVFAPNLLIMPDSRQGRPAKRRGRRTFTARGLSPVILVTRSTGDGVGLASGHTATRAVPGRGGPGRAPGLPKAHRPDIAGGRGLDAGMENGERGKERGIGEYAMDGRPLHPTGGRSSARACRGSAAPAHQKLNLFPLST